MTTTSGYYAPLAVTATFTRGAWTLYVGTTPAGEHVVEFHTPASPRYQRQYFTTAREALDYAKGWLS